MIRNLLFYHLTTIIPLLAILILYQQGFIGSASFVIGLFLLTFVVKPIIDYTKLKAKKLATLNQFLKSFGFIRFKYYRELMFEA